MLTLTIDSFNSSPASFTYPTLDAVLEHMAADLTPWFRPDDWYADLDAMLARHGEAGLITGDLDAMLARHGEAGLITGDLDYTITQH